MNRKGNPGIEVEVDDLEKRGILDQKETGHLAGGVLIGMVQFNYLHTASCFGWVVDTWVAVRRRSYVASSPYQTGISRLVP